MLAGGLGEIGEMMYEGIDFHCFLFVAKISLCALVLPERVQLTHEELAAGHE